MEDLFQSTEYCSVFSGFPPPPSQELVLFCFLKEGVAFQVKCLDLRYLTTINIVIFMRSAAGDIAFFIFLTKMNIVSLKNTVEE